MANQQLSQIDLAHHNVEYWQREVSKRTTGLEYAQNQLAAAKATYDMLVGPDDD